MILLTLHLAQLIGVVSSLEVVPERLKNAAATSPTVVTIHTTSGSGLLDQGEVSVVATNLHTLKRRTFRFAAQNGGAYRLQGLEPDAQYGLAYKSYTSAPVQYVHTQYVLAHTKSSSVLHPTTTDLAYVDSISRTNNSLILQWTAPFVGSAFNVLVRSTLQCQNDTEHAMQMKHGKLYAEDNTQQLRLQIPQDLVRESRHELEDYILVQRDYSACARLCNQYWAALAGTGEHYESEKNCTTLSSMDTRRIVKTKVKNIQTNKNRIVVQVQVDPSKATQDLTGSATPLDNPLHSSVATVDLNNSLLIFNDLKSVWYKLRVGTRLYVVRLSESRQKWPRELKPANEWRPDVYKLSSRFDWLELLVSSDRQFLHTTLRNTAPEYLTLHLILYEPCSNGTAILRLGESEHVVLDRAEPFWALTLDRSWIKSKECRQLCVTYVNILHVDHSLMSDVKECFYFDWLKIKAKEANDVETNKKTNSFDVERFPNTELQQENNSGGLEYLVHCIFLSFLIYFVQ